MLTSFKEFKFFQSFRIPLESKDEVRCMVEYEDELGKYKAIMDGELEDTSITGLGFKTKSRIKVDTNVRFSIQYKRLRIEVEGVIVRSFGYQPDQTNETMLYGVELDEDDFPQMKRFIEQYVLGFSPDRARDCITTMAISERYKRATEGFEIFSLMLSLFKDITAFGSQETFLQSMLEEISRILNAQRASIFLINSQTNELEAVAALGIDRGQLKFDYRKGIAGSVFTTGVPLNIDAQTDKVRFSQDMDKKTGFETRSILCNPISNRDDKVIGVIEVLNKRNQDRFTEEDEKTMKVLALIFSSVFHNYNPISEKSLIRRFSTPYDREFAYIGKSTSTNEIRRSIVKLKDIDSPLLIQGEFGVGKKLLARIVHNEGKRGLNKFFILSCKGVSEKEIDRKIFGDENNKSVLEECQGGTVVFDEVSFLSLDQQMKLLRVLKERRLPNSNYTIDVRAIFTAGQDLKKIAQLEDCFNFELYNYMQESILMVDPLRKRPDDIEPLTSYFLRKECRKQGLLLKEFSKEVLDQLKQYDWSGNVIELEQAVQKAVLYNPKAHVISKLNKTGATPVIDLSQSGMHGLDNIPHARDFNLALKDRVSLVEREMILAEIKRNKGNKSKAAKEMGISREALRKKLLQSDHIIEGLQADDSDIKQAA
ncbi:MAG: sigma-54-dependent Fis family transcriptional regulator [Halobacteriovoraceae bacterium]|nr:sigma-54-dependent Fis family transcriptional regulator [Halobacteriovoraceae bacterium]